MKNFMMLHTICLYIFIFLLFRICVSLLQYFCMFRPTRCSPADDFIDAVNNSKYRNAALYDTYYVHNVLKKYDNM